MMGKTRTVEDFLKVSTAAEASFSPDGTKIAYLSNSPGTFQIFLTPVEGGTPEQLTDFDDQVSFVRFSPTQNILVFEKAKGGDEQTQLYLLELDTGKITNITNNPTARYIFGGWSPDGSHICFASNERNGEDTDVYVMNIDTLEKHCVFKPGGSCAVLGFSPKGTYLIIRKHHSSFNNELYLYNVETGAVDHLTPHKGDVYYAWAAWLPDESAFFFVQNEGREFDGLARYSIGNKETEYVLTPKWDVGRVVVDKDGSCMAVSVNEDGYERVTLYDPRTLAPCPHQPPVGSIYKVSFSPVGTHMSFNYGDSRHTSDIWVLNLATGESRQVTFSSQGVPPEELVEPKLVRFESFDGLTVPAFIYEPIVTKQKVGAPVVIDIHGGPEAQHRPVYQALAQYLVYAGFAVVAPNVRGSSGYGKSYMALDDLEKRLDAVKDVVALRNYLANVPGLNAEKTALFGISYGGFMVLACLAFYPEYWAAGVDVVGIVNFVTFLENTAPYRRAHREAEYGSLAKDRELLQHISPIRSVGDIQAPLFVVHGANDPRVPVSEAEQLVAKLEELNRPVELIVYPDEGHGIAKLKNKLDVYPKAVQFLKNALADN